jgi:hypothetical protein
MAYVATRRRRGLGADPSQIVGIASSVGTPIATAAAAPAAIAAGLLPASLAVPIIGAALAGVTFAVITLIRNTGCGPTCIQATQYANQSATLMQQNMQAYFSLPAPRPKSAQSQALANFDALWAQLVKLCSDPALGNAGKRCISERQPGGKYDDAKFNRDPIANDPNVVPDAQASLSSAAASLFSGSSGVSLPALAVVGLLVLAGVYFL